MRGKGFTLIELLVTVSILAILMTIALLSYGTIQKNARDNKRKSDISSIQSALEQYHADQGYYPVSPLSWGASLTFVGTTTKTYMSKVPQDSKVAYQYVYTATNCIAGTNCKNYCMYAPLENSSNYVNVSNCTANTNQYQTQAP